jgi:hypothetical protein
MTSVLSMLQRVRKLEQARAAPQTPFEQAYGSLAGFTDAWQGEIDAGTMDPIDGPIVIQCILKWHADRVWATGHRNSGTYTR